MLGQQQQQLYSSAALLTGERSRLLTCYVQDYLECVESLPHDMQRNVSVLRELDNKYQGRGRGAAGESSPTRVRWPPGTVARSLPGEVPLSISPVTVSPTAQRGSGVWDGGTGLETGFAALPFPAAVGEDFSGVSRVRVVAVCQPPLQTQRLQLVWRGISHFKKHLFRPSPARCRRPSCPGRERAAGRGLWGVSGRPRPDSRWPPGPGFPHPPSGSHPLRADALERAGGRGRERAAKAASGEVPPSALRLPARE